MKINISSFNGNVYKALRDAGYHPQRNQKSKQDSFLKPLLQDSFPRFHIYFDHNKKIINLHLDHKAPRYSSSRDHGAEYNEELVKEEAERIRKFFN